MNLPLERISKVATSLATFCGRRLGRGVTVVPIRIFSVRAAIAASVIHGSNQFILSCIIVVPHKETIPSCIFSSNCQFKEFNGISLKCIIRDIDSIFHRSTQMNELSNLVILYSLSFSECIFSEAIYKAFRHSILQRSRSSLTDTDTLYD